MDSIEFLLLLPTWKKTKLSRIVQLTILRKRTHVAGELFFYVELWPENTNPQHRHFPFAMSKNFSETLYETKNPRQVFETYGQDRFWPFSVCCFKIYSGGLAFGIFTAISTVPKEQS